VTDALLFDGFYIHAYTENTMTAVVKSKTPLIVPDAVRRRAGFRPGDQVEFKVSRGTVTILTKRLVHREPGDKLTPAEAKKLRHAIKQVREGKLTPWPQVKHELGL
jgi:bifunctional DNA-binding transcriptional regulator/antitoxin component of YhaV-PrlF toxin-antitoxin module